MLVAETETTRKTLHQIHNKGEVTNAWLRKVLLHNTYVFHDYIYSIFKNNFISFMKTVICLS